MKLVFKTDPELSFFHAAATRAMLGSTVDPKIDRAVQEAVEVINERLDLAELDLPRFWMGLVQGEAGPDPQRVESALLRAGCEELGIDSLAPVVLGRLGDARVAFREQFPKLADQLPLRARPLKELWEATGPGTLREIGRRTTTKLIPIRTIVHLVQPVQGGAGGLMDAAAAVWMEAVLSNADPQIPEVLRLAWLVARRGIEGGEQNRLLEAGHWQRASALALVPIALASGAELGTCRADEDAIARAAELWMRCDEAAPLIKWWQQMQQQELPLPVAIKALDKMLD